MPHTLINEGVPQRAAEQGNAYPIDHTVLDRLLCGDQEAIGVVLRQFRSSCPGDASALGAALSRNTRKDAQRWAHRLKGACQMVGAAQLAEACDRAEVAVRAADAKLAAAAVSAIDREVARITNYLDEWMKANP